MSKASSAQSANLNVDFTRLTAFAIRDVGNVLAAAKSAAQQLVDHARRFVRIQMREQLPLEPAREVGTGLRRRDVEFWKVAFVLCHGSPTGGESQPVCRKLSGSTARNAIRHERRSLHQEEIVAPKIVIRES